MKVISWLTAFNIKCIYYSSMVLGVFPFIYNARDNTVSRSTALELYSLFIHLTSFLAVNPLGYKLAQQSDRHFLTKDFVLMIEIFASQIRIISGLLTLFLFYKKRSDFEIFINQILKLNATTFKVSKGSGERIERKLLCMFLLKMHLSGTIGWIFVSNFLQSFKKIGLLHLAALAGSSCIITFHMFTVVYFYTAVGFLTKFFEITNKKLEKIHQDYKYQRTSSNQLKGEVVKLTNLYGQLFHLHTFLIKVYETQIVSSLVSSFVCNVSAGFATYTLYHSEHVNWFAFGTYSILTTANYLDSYLTSVICNKNCQLWRTATEILGQFTNLRSSDGGFDKVVSFDFD